MRTLPESYVRTITRDVRPRAADRHKRAVPDVRPRTSGYHARGKRVVDIVASSVLIAGVLSWLTPLLYVLIKLDSKGPLFFIQERTGRNGKPFRCIKFRTMRVNSECDSQPAASRDLRVTRLGKFLRTSHIDELPQLINVLLNQMSLVGPRPHMISHDELFAEVVPHYSQRHTVKPGITGLAQAWGYHGSIPDFHSISCRTRLDIFYSRKASLGLDLRIIFRTVFVRSVNRLAAMRVQEAASTRAGQ